ncbi:MAG: glycosyl transferase [Bacteroidota bacterium]
MKRAADGLLVPVLAAGAPACYFLTGKKFWPLTAFCAYSFLKEAGKPVRPVFIDDGSIDRKLYEKIKKQFPGCIIRTAKEIEAALSEHLPKSQFPAIHQKRKNYPHIKKLTDVHAGSQGWKLVLDSDMLFFKPPRQLTDWLEKPGRPFFLRDPYYAYHYSLPLLEEIAGDKLVSQLNVGAAGLRSEDIDWSAMEKWIVAMEAAEGSSYLLEQALTAMIVAGKEVIVADPKEYVVLPGKEEIITPSATLHHYVAESKEWYYKQAWKKVI